MAEGGNSSPDFVGGAPLESAIGVTVIVNGLLGSILKALSRNPDKIVLQMQLLTLLKIWELSSCGIILMIILITVYNQLTIPISRPSIILPAVQL